MYSTMRENSPNGSCTKKGMKSVEKSDEITLKKDNTCDNCQNGVFPTPYS